MNPAIKKVLSLSVCISLASLMGGCASIIKGTTQAIPISSDPIGARVSVDGSPSGTTPTKLELKRKTNHMVVLELDGYEQESVAITHSIGGAVYGNIIAGGLVGWGVDATTGAQYNLHPETIDVRLRKKAAADSVAAVSGDKTKEFIAELNNLDALLEEKKITSDEYQKMRAALVAKYGQ